MAILAISHCCKSTIKDPLLPLREPANKVGNPFLLWPKGNTDLLERVKAVSVISKLFEILMAEKNLISEEKKAWRVPTGPTPENDRLINFAKAYFP